MAEMVSANSRGKEGIKSAIVANCSRAFRANASTSTPVSMVSGSGLICAIK